MSFVIDGLFIGSLDDVCRKDDLKQKNITHILTIESKPLPIEFRTDFEYMYIHALDMETMDLLQSFNDAITFIDNGRKSGGVIVHCLVGQSRSATIVLGYLMHKLDMSLDDALTILMKQRPSIRPNPGFMSQLKLFESMGNIVDSRNDEYKLYRLKSLRLQMQTASIESFPKGMLAEDPISDMTGNNDTVLYKCSKCRRPLFKSSSILHHTKGLGEAAFDWRASLSNDQSTDEICVQSLFTEPVQWMQDTILALEGKLICPKCALKLGSFNWSGDRCPCGAWVTPSFHIQSGKVDKCQQINRLSHISTTENKLHDKQTTLST